MARTVNTALLNQLIKSSGFSMRELQNRKVASMSLLSKLRNNRYPPRPKDETRANICAFFGVDEDELFPRNIK